MGATGGGKDYECIRTRIAQDKPFSDEGRISEIWIHGSIMMNPGRHRENAVTTVLDDVQNLGCEPISSRTAGYGPRDTISERPWRHLVVLALIMPESDTNAA